MHQTVSYVSPQQLLILHPQNKVQQQPALVLSLQKCVFAPGGQGTILILDRFRKGLSSLPKPQIHQRSQQALMDVICNFAHLEITSCNPGGFNIVKVPL